MQFDDMSRELERLMLQARANEEPVQKQQKFKGIKRQVELDEHHDDDEAVPDGVGKTMMRMM